MDFVIFRPIGFSEVKTNLNTRSLITINKIKFDRHFNTRYLLDVHHLQRVQRFVDRLR